MVSKHQLTVVADPGQQDVVLSRMFDAPRELVWKVITDPTHIPNWWGPSHLKTVVEKMDVQQGGMWRFVQRDPKGAEYVFFGVYHEVRLHDRIVQTFEFNFVPGHVALETMTLEDVGGLTIMTARALYQSQEDRDNMVKSGMETGARETYERLEQLLNRLQQSKKG